MDDKIEHVHRYSKVTIGRTFVYQASNLVIRRAQRNIGSALQVTPGGNQVDGLPPAASARRVMTVRASYLLVPSEGNTDRSCSAALPLGRHSGENKKIG